MSIAPLLNVAKSLAPPLLIKGLEKINPKFKNFFTEAAAYGYSADQALEYLTNRFSPNSQFQQELEQRQQQGNARPDESAALTQIQNQQIPGKALRSAAAYGGAAALGAIGATTTTGSQPKTSDQGDQSQQPTEGFDPLAGLAQFPELLRFIQSEQSSGGNAQSIASKARKSTKLRTFVETIEQKANEPFENLLARLLGTGSQQQTQQNSGDDALMAAFDRILKM